MKLQNIRYSDLITTSRVFLVAIFAGILSFEPEVFKFIPGILLIAFIFFTDTLDGIVARKWKENSKFGAFYDIVGDRITEVTLLIPFTYLNIASPLILIYFVVKNFLIDYIRFKKFVQSDSVPFKQLNNKINSFLVSSRFMRASYGTSKMAMIFVFYSQIFYAQDWLNEFSTVVAIFTVAISFLRSAPSFIEYGINTYIAPTNKNKF